MAGIAINGVQYGHFTWFKARHRVLTAEPRRAPFGRLRRGGSVLLGKAIDPYRHEEHDPYSGYQDGVKGELIGAIHV